MAHRTDDPGKDWDEHCKDHPDVVDESPVETELLEPKTVIKYTVDNGCINKRDLRPVRCGESFYYICDTIGHTWLDIFTRDTEEEAFKMAQDRINALTISIQTKSIHDLTQ